MDLVWAQYASRTIAIALSKESNTLIVLLSKTPNIQQNYEMFKETVWPYLWKKKRNLSEFFQMLKMVGQVFELAIINTLKNKTNFIKRIQVYMKIMTQWIDYIQGQKYLKSSGNLKVIVQ